MRFADFIAPLTVEDFTDRILGKQPAHIPAADARMAHPLLDWEQMSQMFSSLSHWTEGNIRLVMNSRPVAPEFYMEEVARPGGSARRAVPARVNVFLAMGASLVANFVEDIHEDVRAVTSMLGERFAAVAGANAYCSFAGIQAFATHCDLHEVFALQCEGEKLWTIYENCAAAPVESLDSDDAQAIIDRSKGKVLLQARMRPGDLLYIPRGYYHDALATSDSSLHLTFSVTPLTARAVFKTLEEAAIQDRDFREYLADGRAGGGKDLNEQLAHLADKLSALMRTRAFADRISARQQELWNPRFRIGLPERPQLHFYARTERPAEIVEMPSGFAIVSSAGRVELGQMFRAAQWLLARPAFSLEELIARFPQIEEVALGGLVETLERQGLLFPYTPQLA